MKNLRSLALVLGMLLLILDSGTALQGAKEGIVLCVSSVIPALLPFWVLSALLTGSLWGNSSSLFSFLGRLFSIPAGAESLLIPAFLGGYPAGAGCIGMAYQEGRLEKQQAQRLLGYCCNVGPAFLFGIVAPQMESLWEGGYLWMLQILGAWTASWLIPGKADAKASVGASGKSDILEDAVISMGKICVSVILFRVVLGFIGKVIPSESAMGVILSGLLELTNGCCHLSQLPVGIRLPTAAGLMALGGVCVALQTASVTRGLGLGMYTLGKSIACMTAILGAWHPWILTSLPILWLVKRHALYKKGVPQQKPGASLRKSNTDYKKEKHAESVLNLWWARRDLNPHVRSEH